MSAIILYNRFQSFFHFIVFTHHFTAPYQIEKSGKPKWWKSASTQYIYVLVWTYTSTNKGKCTSTHPQKDKTLKPFPRRSLWLAMAVQSMWGNSHQCDLTDASPFRKMQKRPSRFEPSHDPRTRHVFVRGRGPGMSCLLMFGGRSAFKIRWMNASRGEECSNCIDS